MTAITNATTTTTTTRIMIIIIYSPVEKFIDGDRHVARLLRARIQVPVVLRQQIHVVEDKAVERSLFQGLHVADVHQHRPVELPST
jgi:hypothetical protein